MPDYELHLKTIHGSLTAIVTDRLTGKERYSTKVPDAAVSSMRMTELVKLIWSNLNLKFGDRIYIERDAYRCIISTFDLEESDITSRFFWESDASVLTDEIKAQEVEEASKNLRAVAR